MIRKRKEDERLGLDIGEAKSMSKPFYILSIDGGGFRGLFAAHLLKRMEEEWQIGLEKPLSSTGRHQYGGNFGRRPSLWEDCRAISRLLRDLR